MPEIRESTRAPRGGPLEPDHLAEVDARCQALSRALARQFRIVVEHHGSAVDEEIALEALDAYVRRAENRALPPVEHVESYLRQVVRSKYLDRVQDLLAAPPPDPFPTTAPPPDAYADPGATLDEQLDADASLALLDAVADTVLADTDDRYVESRSRAWDELRRICTGKAQLCDILLEDYALDPADARRWNRERGNRYQSHLRFRAALRDEAARWPEVTERRLLLAIVDRLAWCEKSPSRRSLSA